MSSLSYALQRTYTHEEVSEAIQLLMNEVMSAQKEMVAMRTALEKINCLNCEDTTESFWKAKHTAELALNLHKLRAD